MPYMRIQESKFWSWVTASVLIGLVIGGAAGYFTSQAAAAQKVATAKSEFTKRADESSAAAAALQAKLSSQEASVAALSEANAQLVADLADAKAAAKKATTTSATSTVSVVSRDISPSSASASETITLTAKVKGDADKVTMRLTGKSVTFNQTYTLKKVSTSGSTVTWRTTTKAPGKKGDYRYYATAFSGTTEVTMVGASPSTFTVK